MNDRTREMLLGGILAGALVAALVVDSLAGEPPSQRPSPVRGSRYVSRAVFCPPTLEEDGASGEIYVSSTADARVDIEPGVDENIDLPAGRLIAHATVDRSALEVIGYGSVPVATASTRYQGPEPGVGASACTAASSDTWYLPQGSSTLTSDERLLIFNPFPEEAVVRITFLTPKGERSKANLQEVPVPAGESISRRLNEFILRQPILAARVSAHRGRVVAWRTLFASPEEGGDGIDLSLGANRSASTWYFPDGAYAGGVEERIAIMNPGTEEAIVSITLIRSRLDVDGGSDALQPSRLMEIRIPAGASKSVSINRALDRVPTERRAIAAIVQATNDTRIVAERTVRYSGEFEGRASTLGSPMTSKHWFLGPPAARPDNDIVVLFNPGSASATVQVGLATEDRSPSRPPELSDIEVPPLSRVAFPVAKFIQGRALGALVSSSVPLVAERFAYAADAQDVAAMMGIPLRRSAL